MKKVKFTFPVIEKNLITNISATIFLYLFTQNLAALEAKFEYRTVTVEKKQYIYVKTNLPPATLLTMLIASPINNGGNGFVGQGDAVVSTDHIARFGPFSDKTNQLPTGKYQGTITMATPELQTYSVQRIIGPHGENLTGDLATNLPGVDGKGISQKFWFEVTASTSIDSSVSGNYGIGSKNDVWRRFFANENSIIANMNARYLTRENDGYIGFVTYTISNLSENYIVGSPQSVMQIIQANCENKTYNVISTIFFSGKDREGVPLNTLPLDNLIRKIEPRTPFESVFNALCQKSKSSDK